MQTVRVKLEFTMDVPDDWRIAGAEQPDVGFIEIDGIRYEPGLMWLKITDTGGGTAESEPVDDDMHMMLMEHVTECIEEVSLD